MATQIIQNSRRGQRIQTLAQAKSRFQMSTVTVKIVMPSVGTPRIRRTDQGIG